jgi:hypothetical protein
MLSAVIANAASNISDTATHTRDKLASAIPDTANMATAEKIPADKPRNADVWCD